MQPYWLPEYNLTPKEWNAVVILYQTLQDHNRSFYNIDAVVKAYQALRDLAIGNPNIIAQFLTGE